MLNLSNSSLSFSKFEENYDFKIPNEFKLFLNKFNLNSLEIYIRKSDFNYKVSNLYYEIKIENITSKLIIDRFFSNENIINEWENYINSDSLWNDYKILPIAYLSVPAHTRLFLGVLPDVNFGTVILDSNDEMIFKYGKRLYTVSNNFLQFILGIENLLNEDRINQISGSRDKLYKNWGEDFWRIRE